MEVSGSTAAHQGSRPGAAAAATTAVTALLLAWLAACADHGPRGPRFTAVAAGARHACAISEDRDAWCWGNGGAGALGGGTLASSPVPARVTAGVGFVSITAGFLHSCALTPAGEAWCWGFNGNGELGDGTTTDRQSPVRVAGGHSFASVSAGEGYTCGITTGAELFCWGVNLVPQDTVPRDHTRPARVGVGTWLDVSVGYEIACAVEARQGACWGYGAFGQLGTGDTLSSNQPQPLALSLTPQRISAGHWHGCALLTGGEAWCWGANPDGRLGRPGVPGSTEPGPVTTALRFAQLDAHTSDHTCAVTAAGDAYCWGNNARGQLGDGASADRAIPAPVRVP